METSTPDVKIREVLSVVRRYFSDTIPPVQAAESIATLLQVPPQLMASEIIGWISTQFQQNNSHASVADYLFHTVSKLNYMAQLQLISEQTLSPYLDLIKKLLLEYCPMEDRQLLKENFDRIGTSETATNLPISHIYHQVKSGESESEIPEVPTSDQLRIRRLSILQDRLKSIAGQTFLPSRKENREDWIPHLIATAASSARSGDEFRRFQDNLKSLGIDSRTDQIFRTLSRSLPGWMIAAPDTGMVKSQNPAIEAMCQIIYLAEDRGESCKRFQDMVQAAIEQFNTGSLARAATMFDLALSIGSDNKLDPETVASVRKTAHESLDLNLLSGLAKAREKHHLLRKVLNFFDAFTVKNLLDSLQIEEERKRRRQLLDLIEIHGDVARKMAFERLQEHLTDTKSSTDWYFARNLVFILNRIPRAGDVKPKLEIDLVAPLLQLSFPEPLVKEVINFASQTKCDESEDLLISTADILEEEILEYTSSGRDPTQKLPSLLDRTMFALAHYGTPKAYRRVVKHGVSRHKKLGDTSARLAYLSGQDLTADRESLALLIQFLKSKIPRKLLGMTIHKNEQLLIHAIKALSSTPAPIVQETYQEIATQFPETKFGRSAAKALKRIEASDIPGTPAERVLTGDLELFGLPDLLQQLNLLKVTGTLMIKDVKGNLAGTFSVHEGYMQDCSAGHLEGKVAAYQLLERPIAGTFEFQGQRNSGIQEQPKEHKLPDLNSVLSEGMRRYDELQRARAIVPDFALLRRKGSETMPLSQEEDAELSNLIWQKTAAGTSPEECEAICQADSYRIRTLLARWIEEDVLTIQ